MRRGDLKILRLDARHPGLRARVDEMFAAFKSIDAVEEMIEREYHEPLSHTTVRKYKVECWTPARKRELAQEVHRIAFQEFAREGRN
jgi:hypothetical protein